MKSYSPHGSQRRSIANLKAPLMPSLPDSSQMTPEEMWQHLSENCVLFVFPEEAELGAATLLHTKRNSSCVESKSFNRATVYAKYGPGIRVEQPLPKEVKECTEIIQSVQRKQQPPLLTLSASSASAIAAATAAAGLESTLSSTLGLRSAMEYPTVVTAVKLRGAAKGAFLQNHEVKQLINEEEKNFLCEVYSGGDGSQSSSEATLLMRCGGAGAKNVNDIQRTFSSGVEKAALLHSVRSLKSVNPLDVSTYSPRSTRSTVKSTTAPPAAGGAANAQGGSSGRSKTPNGTESAPGSTNPNVATPDSEQRAHSTQPVGSNGNNNLNTAKTWSGAASSVLRPKAMQNLIAPNTFATALPDSVVGELHRKKHPLLDAAMSITKTELTTLLQVGQYPTEEKDGKPLRWSTLSDALAAIVLTERERRISIMKGTTPTLAALRSDPRVTNRQAAFFLNKTHPKPRDVRRFENPRDVIIALHRYAYQIQEVETYVDKVEFGDHGDALGSVREHNKHVVTNKPSAAVLNNNIKCLKSDFVADATKPGWDGNSCVRGGNGSTVRGLHHK